MSKRTSFLAATATLALAIGAGADMTLLDRIEAVVEMERTAELDKRGRSLRPY